MSSHLATTKIIKAGRSKTSFLLFFGNRKQDENEPVKRQPIGLITALVVLVITVLGICIYAFFAGKLG
jgi:hypothetical protein